jgi:ABC-2 type transport system ATP-binding protein
LARALLPSPKLLLLDEPANGLDPEGIAELREVVRHFGSQGITTLVSSHILSEVEKFAPRVLIINQGKLLRDGPLSTVTQAVGDADAVYRLETSDAPRALEVLRREAWVSASEPVPDGVQLRIPKSGAYRLAPLLVQNGIQFTQLTREDTAHTGDLESLYLQVIGDQGNAKGVA